MTDHEPSAPAAHDDLVVEREVVVLTEGSRPATADPFADAPIGLATLDTSLRFTWVNEALAEVNGRSVAEHTGLHLREVIPQLYGRLRPLLAQVLASDTRVKGQELTGTVHADDREPRTWELSYYPLRDEQGEVVGVGCVVLDVTDRRRALEEGRRRVAQHGTVADIAALGVQGASLDELFDRALGAVARSLSVPLVEVAKLEGGGARLRMRAGVGWDPGTVGTTWPNTPGQLVARALRAGGPVTISGTGESAETVLPPVQHSHGAVVGAAVPLYREGGPYGALCAYAKQPGHLHGGDLSSADLHFLRSLAAVLSGAMQDRAQMARARRGQQEARELADTLQRSLLPPRLPHVPGLALAARYHSGDSGSMVGGDFYDVFPLGGGEWAFTVGDVQGRGAAAAAQAALVRYSIRGAATQEERPSAVLVSTNTALVQQDHEPEPRFCTAVYGRFRCTEGGVRVALARAGHPLPLLLRADGTSQALAVEGELLGVLDTLEIEDEEVLLRPGDSLVCFTDGILEARNEDAELFGEVRLRRALEGLRGAHADEVAGGVQRTVTAFAHRQPDDMAVLVLQVPAPGA